MSAPPSILPKLVIIPLAQVLYVEDQPATAASIQLELEHARIGVTTAPSGEQGLALAREKKFDLILLDQRLPGMDGLEVCRQLKRDPAVRDVPVIFFTAFPSSVHEAEARQSGAVDYLQKGVLGPRLAARILSEVELARDRTSRAAKKSAPDTHESIPPPPAGQ